MIIADYLKYTYIITVRQTSYYFITYVRFALLKDTLKLQVLFYFCNLTIAKQIPSQQWFNFIFIIKMPLDKSLVVKNTSKLLLPFISEATLQLCVCPSVCMSMQFISIYV